MVGADVSRALLMGFAWPESYKTSTTGCLKLRSKAREQSPWSFEGICILWHPNV